MIKLKKIIGSLDEGVYRAIEDGLIKNKADNFLCLFQSYRNKDSKDEEIIQTLNINSNSFYVLKSRLYDKIQDHLSGDIHSDKEEVIKQLHQIQEMCYTSPREVTMAFLHKLEKDLLFYDMHTELLMVYSALKKINLYSEKYFHYSQLYNKHIAFGLSFEKSEEILGSFNVALAQYNFSRSPKQLETLMFLQKGISDHYALNPSRHIEIIKNIIEVQLNVFCNVKNKELSSEEILIQTQKIVNDLPVSSPGKSWKPALDYLFFEYYHKMGHSKQSQIYFDSVNANLNSLLLYTNMCLSSVFLISKISFLQENDKIALLEEDHDKALLYDTEDTHSKVLLGIYRSMLLYYKGQYKEAAVKLNEILNMNSFKDFFHINTEIKLTLAYFYILMKEYDLADNILKNIYRKIKAEQPDNYANVLDLIKVFGADIKQNGGKPTSKQKDHFALFMARNINENKLLSYLVFELKKKYA